VGEPENRSRDAEAGVGMLRILESGVLSGIACPSCGEGAVSVSFARPAEDVYRTWFVCEECGFRLRANNEGRPKYYSDELVDRGLQAYDREVLRKKRLGKK
jgi:predicted RNA-binding Zn-ribbon protein involved in translation (DUF1610 family)